MLMKLYLEMNSRKSQRVQYSWMDVVVQADEGGSSTARRIFVGTQGPLPGTIDDFWRLMWQENSRVIVMITNEVESGKVV